MHLPCFAQADVSDPRVRAQVYLDFHDADFWPSLWVNKYNTRLKASKTAIPYLCTFSETVRIEP